MSSDKGDQTEEMQILKYLKEHPDFFERHPKALSRLSLGESYQSENIESLIDRQVSVLRDEHQDLETTLNTIVERARENENRSICLHRLALALTHQQDASHAAVIKTVTSVLRSSFPSNVMDIWIQSEHEQKLKDQRVENLIASLFHDYQPYGGPFTPAAMAALFGDFAKRIASAVVMPLGSFNDQGNRKLHRFGVLIFGSSQADRFQAGTGTMFLVQCAELITAALARSEPD